MLRRSARTIGLLSLLAVPALAQDMPESYKAAQLRMLNEQQRLLLAMADSMPEQHYRTRVTPQQRDFAQQLHHAAMAIGMIAPRTMGVSAPQLPDTAGVLNTRAGMRSYITAVYDWARATLERQSAAERAEQVNLFGMTIPRWQVWDELHQHTIWTAGQVVANFRMHGMAPPAFSFF